MTQKDARKKWIAALRSGEYKQGKYVLKTDDGRYCCLGVLMDLAQKEGVISDWGSDTLGNTVTSVKAKDWVGLRSRNGEMNISFKTPSRGEKYELSALNDSGMTFAEIADIIESEPSGLFMCGPESAAESTT